MEPRQSRFWLGLVLVLVCLLATPASVESQCGVTMGCIVTTQPIYYFPNMTSPTFIRIDKILAPAAVNCPDPAYIAYGCGEIPGNAGAMTLRASALTVTANPYCNWVCDCGAGCTSQAISTNAANDGLPVELMDFEIAELEPSETDGEGGDQAGGRESR